MKKITAVYFTALMGCMLPLCLPAATLEAYTEPAGDGVLIDTTGDGIVDRVMALKADGEDREVLTGRIWNQTRQAVFEFALPKISGEVTRATLRLSFNGNYGCHPDRADGHGPAVDLYYYLAPEADGKIELTDDSGEKLGPALAAEPRSKAEGKPLAPLELDVTAAVQAAVQAGSQWIGFRLEAVGDAPTSMAWRWRTSEFAAISGRHYHPKLTVVTK